MERGVKGIAGFDCAAQDGLAGERAFVDRREQFEGATRVAAAGERAAPSIHVGHEIRELRRVRGSGVGREMLPSLHERVTFLRGSWGQREFPVVAGVAVKVRELDGGALEIDPN